VNGTIPPAVLDMKTAAEYCGLNYFTFREYVEQGLVVYVRYPSLGHKNPDRPQKRMGKPRRKRLFLKSDLDAFVQRFREDGQQKSGAKVGTRNDGTTTKSYPINWQDRVKERLAR
jgi:hypothetical protein